MAWIVEEAETAAGVLRLGRPALGRSLHAGGAHALLGSGAYRTAVRSPDLSARVYAALEIPVPSQPPHAQPLRATPSRGDGRAGHGRQSLYHQEVVQQIVAKTDGVPLFVEELTKTVLESVESIESVGSGRRLGRSALSLGIPATLQDALMARLDRLGPAKEIAQIGATIGREFSYELLHAVSPIDEETLQHGLKQLVEAELVYQRGVAPQATYLFKHALIQDTAYQSLFKSTRQQYHQQIAQLLRSAVSRDRRDAAGASSASLHRGRPDRASPALLAEGRRASHPALGLCGSGQLTSPGGWRCSRPWRILLSAPSKNSPPARPRRCLVSPPRALRPQRWNKL